MNHHHNDKRRGRKNACGGLLCMDQHGHQGAVPVVADDHAVAAIDGTTQGKFLALFLPIFLDVIFYLYIEDVIWTQNGICITNLI